jgi:hypothetical protein
LVSVNGVGVTNGWTLGDGGILTFTTPPTAGANLRAGFLFDVPVRFEQDTLDISGAGFAMGMPPASPSSKSGRRYEPDLVCPEARNRGDMVAHRPARRRVAGLHHP